MLKLRAFKKCDSHIIAGWFQDEKTFLNWSCCDFLKEEKPLENIEAYCEQWEQDKNSISLVVFSDENPIGIAVLGQICGNDGVVQLKHILIDREKRNEGYGTRMLALVLKYAYEFLGAQKAEACIVGRNEAAYYCCYAVGFRPENTDKPWDHAFGEDNTGSLLMQLVLDDIVVGGFGQEVSSYSSSKGEQEYSSDEEKKVKKIIKTNSFRYAFQPIVSTATGEIFGYEALMRAELNGEPVSPNVVLKYAKKNQKLYDIEKATFNNVFQIIDEKKEEFGDCKVFINSIPGFQLKDKEYDALRSEYAELLKRVVIEITEETELSDKELGTLLERSNQDSFDVAIDDYGTGYSNTASLLKCMPQCVKIDRLLISNIHAEPKKQHFVKSIVEFAHTNGFLALAEGVETQAELRTVIHMGVDLIQGFYTAKPSFDIVQEIDPDIKNDMVSTSIDTKGQLNTKVYVVTDEKKIPLMNLALEQYTGLIVGNQKLELVGNPDYAAGMTIMIKDDCDCELMLRDVHLESIEDLPCIDLGKNAHLTLRVEGNNQIDKVGIRVPEGSKLTVKGYGNLTINAQGIHCYGIGNSDEIGVGEIELYMTGVLKINVEGNNGVAIGGRYGAKDKKLHVHHGEILIDLACEKSIGIGFVKGSSPIALHDCKISIDMKTAVGVGIGCTWEPQVIEIESSEIRINGSGSFLAALGSIDVNSSEIRMRNSKYFVRMNGQQLMLFANKGGGPSIAVEHSHLELCAEGGQVCALGAFDESAIITCEQCTALIDVRSGEPTVIGALDENVHADMGSWSVTVNA